jgi:hypothetical protein
MLEGFRDYTGEQQLDTFLCWIVPFLFLPRFNPHELIIFNYISYCRRIFSPKRASYFINLWIINYIVANLEVRKGQNSTWYSSSKFVIRYFFICKKYNECLLQLKISLPAALTRNNKDTLLKSLKTILQLAEIL